MQNKKTKQEIERELLNKRGKLAKKQKELPKAGKKTWRIENQITTLSEEIKALENELEKVIQFEDNNFTSNTKFRKQKATPRAS